MNDSELGLCCENPISLEFLRVYLFTGDKKKLDICRCDGASNSLLQSLKVQDYTPEPMDRQHLEPDLIQDSASRLLTNRQLNSSSSDLE